MFDNNTPRFTFTFNEKELLAFTGDLALALKRGDCLCLVGDLGAGKTTLARALIYALAGDDAENFDVPSPTFTLVQTYNLTLPLMHIDAYRITDIEEVLELGLEDALDDGITLIEWPDRIANALPDQPIVLSLSDSESSPDKRQLDIWGSDNFIDRLQHSMKKRDFIATNWTSELKRERLAGDASTRSYELVCSEHEKRILMDSPTRDDTQIVRDNKTYSELAHLAQHVHAFVAVADMLTQKDFSAPQIYAHDFDNGFVLLEDLGQEGIIDLNKNPIEERYLQAAACLADLHQHSWHPLHILNNGNTKHKIEHFDLDTLLVEVDLLFDWYLPRFSNHRPTPKERAEYHSIWAKLHSKIGQCDETIILRDYHSPNIIWLGDRIGTKRVGLIDFQDALIGSPAYDVMSLARDARVDIPYELDQKIVDHYIVHRKNYGPFDEDAFRTEAAILAAQRISKILGIFVRLDMRDNKPDYLAHVPRMQRYMLRTLKHPVLEPLNTFLKGYNIIPETDHTQ